MDSVPKKKATTKREQGVPLAKLSRPRLYDALPRERLFRLLDESREHPVTWISGPPGAGKTTLLGSYLQARSLKSVWMQVDDGDRDTTSFFYFLTRACAAAGLVRRGLPRPGPEHMDNPGAFSRLYFRALFPALPANSIVALDNFHELDEPTICAVIDQAIAEIPQGRSLVVTSRMDPPQGLVNHLATQAIARIGWTDLRLDAEETAAILGTDDAAVARELHAEVDGWAAGVVLMRETPHGRGGDRAACTGASRESVFGYFATQVFEQVDPATRDVLLRAAFVPYFSAQWARDLSGNPQAGDIVEHVFRRELFTTRRQEGVFQFHALFREFLLSRAKAELSAAEALCLQSRAGVLLEQAGDFDTAFAALAAAGEWVAARRIVLSHAPELLKRGRWQTLSRWCDSMRSEDFETDPWLVYWRGLAVLATDGNASRALLEDAYRRFVRDGSRTGELLALAHILGSYFLEWDTVESMDAWIDAAQSAVRDSRPVSEEALLRAHASLLVALLYRRPHDPMLHASAKWTSDRIDQEADPTQQLRMAIFLAHYYDLMGEFARAESSLAIAQHILDREEVDPLTGVVAVMRHSQHYLMAGDSRRALEYAERSVASARSLGLPDRLVGFLLVCRAHSLLDAGDLQRAEEDLEAAGTMISRQHRMIVIHRMWCLFWLACLRGDRAQLRSLWDQFADMPPAGVAVNTAYNLPVIHFLAAEGRNEQAVERLERWNAALRPMQSPFIDFNLGLMEACLQMQRGDRAAAERCARAAFALSSAHGFSNTLAWIPAVMADLCALCLESGIEPEHIGQLVRARSLPAPANAPDNWPWRVRVHTLGGFRLFIEGKPLSFSGRPQHRTLELLKLIIAFGGRDVSVARVCAMLWPDSEGDAASRSFAVALHRLRKLLGEGTVELLDGNLSLNGRLCQVDALVFEQHTDVAADLAGEMEAAACGVRLLALYQGHFLEGDDAPWVLPRRQSLRSRFHHAMQVLGARLEQVGDWEGAATLYRHALEKDPLSELFYRRLMACRSRQGHNAEAMETYRRCRDMLSIVLGIAPSAETQALFRAIQAAGSAGEVRQP